jgi:hypothetical protein
VRAVGRESYGIDEVGVGAAAGNVGKFERSTVIEDEILVVTCSGSTEGSLLADAYGIDLSRMAANLTDGIAGVGSNAVTISLFAITNSNDSLTVSVPCYVADSAWNNGIFALGGAWAIRGAIPDSNYAWSITRGTVKAGGGEAGDSSIGVVLCVLCRDGRIVYRPQEDWLVRGIRYPFTFRVRREWGGLASGGVGQSGIDAV